MRKGRDIIGKSIVTLETGERVATVQDLVFDHQGAQLLALLVDEGAYFSPVRVVPFMAVNSFGDDAVVIGAPQDIVPANSLEGVPQILNDKTTLIDTTLMTTDGRNLGRLADLYFDERDGRVMGYDVTGGLFADLSSGRSFVPAEGRLTLGQDVAFVPPETAAAMEEQEPGGLRGVIGTAGQNVRDATTSLADSTRERQRAFVIGKTAGRDVSAQDGTLVIAQGTVITEEHARLAEQHGALGSLFISAGGGALSEGLATAREQLHGGYENVASSSRERQREWVLGKTVANDVTAPNGTLIITSGDTVMEEMVDNAERHDALGQMVVAAGGGVLQSGYEQARAQVMSGVDDVTSAGRERMMEFVVGKVARRQVIAADGAVIVTHGATITPSDYVQAEVHGALGTLLTAAGASSGDLAGPRDTAGMDDANGVGVLGRRVYHDVYGPHGTLIAAQGQIVTAPVLERASALGREQELVQATSRTAAAGQTVNQTGERLREGANNVREGAGSALERARNWVNDTRERAEEANEERRIRNALGRPTTRVILDPSDRVILNVGEIITHKAVEEARQTGVLPILLDSVSTEIPNISPEDVRPNVTGNAALPVDRNETATDDPTRRP